MKEVEKIVVKERDVLQVEVKMHDDTRGVVKSFQYMVSSLIENLISQRDTKLREDKQMKTFSAVKQICITGSVSLNVKKHF